MISMREAIGKIVKNQNLTFEEAKDVMRHMLGGDATQAQIGSFLTGLRMKGETLDEIVGCATVMKEKAEHINPNVGGYIDMVGTGGDGANTFNISTTASFVSAGAGLKIAKHGNRAISSKSGSVDVLEALGINIMLEAEQVQECVEKNGIGFMFAQMFHKSMKNVGIARKEMGIRSVFNILGPLSNPSDAKAQFIGVFSPELTETFAKAMQQMGLKRAMVVNAEDGMDEISTASDTFVSEIKDGNIVNYKISPEQFGFARADIFELKGGDAKENVGHTMNILNGEKGPKRDIVVFNAGAALYIGGLANDIGEGIKLAEKSIDSGMALKKLKNVIEFTNSIK